MLRTIEKRVVSAQVSKEQRQELERLAERGDRTLSAEVRRAIAAHVEREVVSAGGQRGFRPGAPAAGVST